MLYVGLDVHEKYTQIQAMDEAGFLAMGENLPTTSESLNAFFSQLPDTAVVSIEAGRSYWWISQLLNSHPAVREVKVVDPRRSRNLAKELSVQSGYGSAKKCPAGLMRIYLSLRPSRRTSPREKIFLVQRFRGFVES